MRAADTAAGAAATQPAGKPRLKRVMKAHLVNLWHTVAAAGPEGTTVEALTEASAANSPPRASMVSSNCIEPSPAEPRRIMRAVMRPSPSFPGGSCAEPDRKATSTLTTGRALLASTNTGGV